MKYYNFFDAKTISLLFKIPCKVSLHSFNFSILLNLAESESTKIRFIFFLSQ